MNLSRPAVDAFAGGQDRCQRADVAVTLSPVRGETLATFLTEADKAALREAIAAVEARSSAEVVVVVRPASGPYLAADLFAGIAVALFFLWFQLFSPWEFALEWILAGPVVLGALTALAVSRAPGVRRRLTPASQRAEAVRSAARAAFLDRGVDRTRQRTGLLVYVSLLERRAEVVADRGIESAVPAAEWNTKVEALAAAVARGEPGRALAARLAALGEILAAALPRSDEDVDELGNEVVA